MIFHSIKWRLQAWHALMLVVVLAGFGFTAYQLDRVSRFQRIDRELQQRVEVVMRALREDGPPGRPRGGEMRPRPEDFEPERPPRREGDDFRPPPREGRDAGPPQAPRLAPQDLHWFGTNNGSAYYFALFHREGRLLSKSEAAPEGLVAPVRSGSNNLVRVRGNVRELILFTPPGEAIIAGLDVSAEEAELRRLGWLLLTAGGGVLLLYQGWRRCSR